MKKIMSIILVVILTMNTNYSAYSKNIDEVNIVQEVSGEVTTEIEEGQAEEKDEQIKDEQIEEEEKLEEDTIEEGQVEEETEIEEEQIEEIEEEKTKEEEELNILGIERSEEEKEERKLFKEGDISKKLEIIEMGVDFKIEGEKNKGIITIIDEVNDIQIEKDYKENSGMNKCESELFIMEISSEVERIEQIIIDGLTDIHVVIYYEGNVIIEEGIVLRNGSSVEIISSGKGEKMDVKVVGTELLLAMQDTMAVDSIGDITVTNSILEGKYIGGVKNIGNIVIESSEVRVISNTKVPGIGGYIDNGGMQGKIKIINSKIDSEIDYAYNGAENRYVASIGTSSYSTLDMKYDVEVGNIEIKNSDVRAVNTNGSSRGVGIGIVNIYGLNEIIIDNSRVEGIGGIEEGAGIGSYKGSVKKIEIKNSEIVGVGGESLKNTDIGIGVTGNEIGNEIILSNNYYIKAIGGIGGYGGNKITIEGTGKESTSKILIGIENDKIELILGEEVKEYINSIGENKEQAFKNKYNDLKMGDIFSAGHYGGVGGEKVEEINIKIKENREVKMVGISATGIRGNVVKIEGEDVDKGKIIIQGKEGDIGSHFYGMEGNILIRNIELIGLEADNEAHKSIGSTSYTTGDIEIYNSSLQIRGGIGGGNRGTGHIKISNSEIIIEGTDVYAGIGGSVKGVNGNGSILVENSDIKINGEYENNEYNVVGIGAVGLIKRDYEKEQGDINVINSKVDIKYTNMNNENGDNVGIGGGRGIVTSKVWIKGSEIKVDVRGIGIGSYKGEIEEIKVDDSYIDIGNKKSVVGIGTYLGQIEKIHIKNSNTEIKARGVGVGSENDIKVESIEINGGKTYIYGKRNGISGKDYIFTKSDKDIEPLILIISEGERIKGSLNVDKDDNENKYDISEEYGVNVVRGRGGLNSLPEVVTTYKEDKEELLFIAYGETEKEGIEIYNRRFKIESEVEDRNNFRFIVIGNGVDVNYCNNNLIKVEVINGSIKHKINSGEYVEHEVNRSSETGEQITVQLEGSTNFIGWYEYKNGELKELEINNVKSVVGEKIEIISELEDRYIIGKYEKEKEEIKTSVTNGTIETIITGEGIEIIENSVNEYYDVDSEVVVKVEKKNDDYRFVGWYEKAGEYYIKINDDENNEISKEGDKEVIKFLVKKGYKRDVTGIYELKTQELSIKATEGGEVTNEGGTYDIGDTIISETKTIDDRYEFVGWYEKKGDLYLPYDVNDLPENIKITGDKNEKIEVKIKNGEDLNISAKYTLIKTTVEIKVNNKSKKLGTVSSYGGKYIKGTEVKVKAIANDINEFIGWYENGIKLTNTDENITISGNEISITVGEEGRKIEAKFKRVIEKEDEPKDKEDEPKDKEDEPKDKGDEPKDKGDEQEKEDAKDKEDKQAKCDIEEEKDNNDNDETIDGNCKGKIDEQEENNYCVKIIWIDNSTSIYYLNEIENISDTENSGYSKDNANKIIENNSRDIYCCIAMIIIAFLSGHIIGREKTDKEKCNLEKDK